MLSASLNKTFPSFLREFGLAALEKTSADAEKMINEAKSEKLKHMEELYQSHRKIAELEAK